MAFSTKAEKNLCYAFLKKLEYLSQNLQAHLKFVTESRARKNPKNFVGVVTRWSRDEVVLSVQDENCLPNGSFTIGGLGPLR